MVRRTDPTAGCHWEAVFSTAVSRLSAENCGLQVPYLRVRAADTYGAGAGFPTPVAPSTAFVTTCAAISVGFSAAGPGTPSGGNPAVFHPLSPLAVPLLLKPRAHWNSAILTGLRCWVIRTASRRPPWASSTLIRRTRRSRTCTPTPTAAPPRHVSVRSTVLMARLVSGPLNSQWGVGMRKTSSAKF